MTLFLDFDGALHPDPCVVQFKFCQRNPIEGILCQFPQVGPMLSTNWRPRYPLDTSGDTLKHHFSSDIAECIVGVTPSHKGLDRNQAPDGIDL